MGRKKAYGDNQQSFRPFCFFCDRTFDDETVLLQHQRAKHFRCPECGNGAVPGKCESIQGLIVHTLKVHGKSLTRVPNAQQGRDNPELNIYGMDGIPAEVLREKGYAEPGSSADQSIQKPAPAAVVPPTNAGMPPALPGMLPGMPPCMPGLPPGIPGFPPGMLPSMVPPPGMLPGMPGMPPSFAPGLPDTGLSDIGNHPGAPAAGLAPPGTMPDLSSLPAMLPPECGPSIEGFQKFLAAQGLPTPGPSMLPPQSVFPPNATTAPDGFGMAGFPSPAFPGGGPPPGVSVPNNFPPTDASIFPGGPILSNGSNHGMTNETLSGMDGPPSKKQRTIEDVVDEDISVEERRAMLERYR